MSRNSLSIIKLNRQIHWGPFIQHANYSSEHKRSPGQNKGFAIKPDESSIDQDYIGPPDGTSNLRPILRHTSKQETALQTKLRLKQIEVEKWNQEFWTKHNNKFYNEKCEFLKTNKTSEDDTLSADKMSEFYKQFLDQNWRTHFNYNLEWYKKNFELLYLSLQNQIGLDKIFRRKI